MLLYWTREWEITYFPVVGSLTVREDYRKLAEDFVTLRARFCVSPRCNKSCVSTKFPFMLDDKAGRTSYATP
jgi:hypothetical protein